MSRYSKLIAALVGVAAQLVALGFFDTQVLTVGIAVLTALGVYEAPANTPDIRPSRRDASPHMTGGHPLNQEGPQ